MESIVAGEGETDIADGVIAVAWGAMELGAAVTVGPAIAAAVILSAGAFLVGWGLGELFD